MRTIVVCVALLLACSSVAAQPSPLDTNAVSTPPYGVMSWDWEITRAFNSIDKPAVNTLSGIVSESLLPLGLAVPGTMLASANWQWFSRNAADNRYLAESGALVLAAEVGTGVLTVALKQLTSRARPYLAHPEEIVGRVDEILSSFPSGHAAVSSSIATMLSLRYPKWYVIAPSALWSLTMSCSRMHLGVHYFTDVLAGTLLGSGVAVLVYSLRRDILPHAEFLLPDAPPSAEAQNTKIQAAAKSMPLGLSATANGVSLNFAIPLR